MNKIKMQKGITLIALIITVIILLILAIVTIGAIKENEIILKAQQVKEIYQSEQVKEKVSSELEEWKILKHTQADASLPDFLAEKFGAENVITNEDGTYTVIVDAYEVMIDIDGNITGIKNNTNSGDTTEKDDSSSEEIAMVTWTDNGNGTFTASNGVTVKIGDYVDYNEGTGYTHTPDVNKGVGTNTSGSQLTASEISTENLNWRVLGINEESQLELISADPITQTLRMQGDLAYLYAEDNLNNFCNDLYGKGTYAESARSLNADDINNLTNYDPTTLVNYGKKWQYRYSVDAQSIQYRNSSDNGTTWSEWTNVSMYRDSFRAPGETIAMKSSNYQDAEGNQLIVNLEHTYYTNDISTNLTTDDGYTSEQVTEILNMITKGTTSSNILQWLASRCVNASNNFAGFGIYFIASGEIVRPDYPYISNEQSYIQDRRVRPVVTLSSNVSVTTNENANSADNMWTLSK